MYLHERLFQVPCLGKTEYGKRDQEIFMQAPSSRYLEMHSKLLCRATTKHCRWEVQFHAIEQEKKGVAQAESQHPCLNQEHELTFCVIGKYNFFVSQDYIQLGVTDQHVTR